MDNAFARFPGCFEACEGHMDDSASTQHSTALDYFGTDGPVAVTKVDGCEPKVSLVNMHAPQHDLTPGEARIVAWQLLTAADLAEKVASEDPALLIARGLQALQALAARAGVSA